MSEAKQALNYVAAGSASESASVPGVAPPQFPCLRHPACEML